MTVAPLDRRAFLKSLALAPFARFGSLQIPGVLGTRAAQSGAPDPDVELTLTAAPSDVSLLPGASTRVWRYTVRLIRGPASTVQPIDGTYLGPVIRLRRGQRVRIRFINQIGEPSIVHWHGLEVPALADGHPRLAVPHGGEYVYDFEVTNRAGTYWYHPHPDQRTGAQVYRGLAGLLLVSDPEEDGLGLPSGAAEMLCVLQDRRFDANNQAMYLDSAQGGRMRGMGGPMMMGRMGQMMNAMDGWIGDRVLVTGRLQPKIDVDRRTYRVRILNGSNARIYRLAWSDQSPMTVIGGDGGLHERARTFRFLTLAPGQRADVLLDLSSHTRGSQVQLQSLGFPAADAGTIGMMGRSGMMGSASPVPQGAPLTLMTLVASGGAGPRFRMPDTLSNHSFREFATAPTRRVPLTLGPMALSLDGRVFAMNDVATVETVLAGSTHIWEFVNEAGMMGMEMAHPIHLHGPQFRVLRRTGGSANALRAGIDDSGWIDTVLVLPGETVRTQIKFSEHPGLYLYHCHILEHEDMGMMRNFLIR